MNTQFLLRLCPAALCVVVALGLASCASPVERRIASNPEIYSKLPESDKTLVSQGRIREGLTKEGVFLAWGRPDNVAQGTQKGSQIEKWTYVGNQPVYVDNYGWGGFGLGRGWGRGYGYYGAWDPYWGGYGSSVAYVPYKAASVTFRSNRVIEYIRGPQ